MLHFTFFKLFSFYRAKLNKKNELIPSFKSKKRKINRKTNNQYKSLQSLRTKDEIF